MQPTAVKFAPESDDTLLICAIPTGGIFNGRDTDGEYFSPHTELCLDWFPETRPLLYEHGMDDGTGVSVIGRVDIKSLTRDERGVWVQAQLDKANRYYEAIKELIEKSSLYASSGAMG